jgi:WhiB family redox-sensing transcriptional regulator
MDLSAVIARGFAVTDRMLWGIVIGQAACSTSGRGPDDWYPVSTPAGTARREAAEALAVCAACPVREECLELALRNWTVGQHGVWGGTVPAERQELRTGRVAQLTRILARSRAEAVSSRGGPDECPTGRQTTALWGRSQVGSAPTGDGVGPRENRVTMTRSGL